MRRQFRSSRSSSDVARAAALVCGLTAASSTGPSSVTTTSSGVSSRCDRARISAPSRLVIISNARLGARAAGTPRVTSAAPLQVGAGSSSVCVVYRSVRDLLALETLVVGGDGLIGTALQRPALEAISASGDADVTAAWGSPQTRQRLAGHLAALAGKPAARTSA